MPLSDYEITIGLEVHVQLKTRTKMFCGCRYEFNATPNTLVCPVCLGLPGALPVPNADAIEISLRAGLALGCEIQGHSYFERKNYFYPDLPKGYQISQRAVPFAQRGKLTVPRLTDDGKPDPDGRTVTVGIHEAHMEEDTAKNFHAPTDGHETSLVDYNRSGVPLLEIVTEPDMHDPDDAYAYLLGLKRLLQFMGISDCEMQEGSLRCDANVSLAAPGATELGAKAEVKNLNSFKAVRDALNFEAQRQAELLDKGERVVQETRGWRDIPHDPFGGETVSQRAKEAAHDYRYFPEPDLPDLAFPAERVDGVRATLPESPFAREKRYVDEFDLSRYDASVLCAMRADADFFEASFEAARDKRKMQREQGVKLAKACADLFKNQVKMTLNERKLDLADYPLSAQSIGKLARLVADGRLPNQNLKQLYDLLLGAPDADPESLGADNQLFPEAASDDDMAKLIEQAFAAQPQAVADAKAGKDAAKNRLVGEVMRLCNRRYRFPDIAAAIDARLGEAASHPRVGGEALAPERTD